MNWVLGKVAKRSRCGTSAGDIKVTDRVFSAADILLAESPEVLVIALEVLYEEAKPL